MSICLFLSLSLSLSLSLPFSQAPLELLRTYLQEGDELLFVSVFGCGFLSDPFPGCADLC